MTTAQDMEIDLPSLPSSHVDFIKFISENSGTSVLELVKPYNQYDAVMRKVFAQKPHHPAVADPSIVPVFKGHETALCVQARDLQKESETEKEAYIMPLKDEDRRANGSPAIVQSLKDFRTNFNVFSETALAELDWSNVVAAGSSVVTSLLAVPRKHSSTKRALRTYYHEQLAPASDIDLFIYGLTEEQAKAKIKQIEQNIRDSILVETTTIRTKNAITIASQYPTRHIQIVLRIYKSISEILTGFDVDCSCAAYDGKQVYASPRALAAYMTQINTIDLTRRSPSYESRLSKYAHRGFEVYWPLLDRSRIDPTIFERSFGRTEGLARLLILEKLPKTSDREAYLDQRRKERGRPSVNRWRMRARMIHGNIKNDYEDEVAEWVEADEVSNYHTFTIPYGPKFHARKIEKLLYTKDLLLNAEWNRPKDREVNLHRHPAFFGRTTDVFHDCCGTCPNPLNQEEEEIAKEEGKIYVSREVNFIKDDPGRQTIGSFHPLSADDWTEMAYIGNTELLCKAIVDGDADYVRSWLEQKGNDPNTRDYTGRTPLHLAVANSTLEVVQTLIDHDARLVARLVDGKTALHLAAMRGDVQMVSALLRKSEANEEEESKRLDARKLSRETEDGEPLDDALKHINISQEQTLPGSTDDDSDIDMVSNSDTEVESIDATTEHSMIKIKSPAPAADDKALEKDDADEPDIYDVNVVAWDAAVSPLHLAIVHGHLNVVKTLVQEFGADVLLPVKLVDGDRHIPANTAILTLVLATQLPFEQAKSMALTLIELGASSAQADARGITAFHFSVADCPDMLSTFVEADRSGVTRSTNHTGEGRGVIAPFLTAIQAKDTTTALHLLAIGSKPELAFESNIASNSRNGVQWLGTNRNWLQQNVQQPIIAAVQCELPDVALALAENHGVDVNTLTALGYSVLRNEYARNWQKGKSLLDEVREHAEELRQWEHEESKSEPPLPLKDDESYLGEHKDGSYALWSAVKQLKQAKDNYERDLKAHREILEKFENQPGLAEKRAAVKNMLKRFEYLEAKLVEKGAKTFEELHPDIEKPDQPHRPHYFNTFKPKPFQVEFNFGYQRGLSDKAIPKYLELFEASWGGDLQKVKELTLSSWKDADGDMQPPLLVAIQDQHSMSPFAVAILHGHLRLASAILEIAKAQYAPPEDPLKRRYRLSGGNDEDDSDASGQDGDDIKIYSEIIDEQFTIEDIGKISTQVKSQTTPQGMIRWQCFPAAFMDGPLRSSPRSSDGFSYFGPRRTFTMAGKRTNTGSLKAPSNSLSEEKRKHIGQPSTLIQFALHTNDVDLLDFLLSKGLEYTKAGLDANDEDAIRYFEINDDDYLTAIKLDRPWLLAEIIKRIGAGIPLNRLVKKTGVELTRKPKYYQGLSVYGKKRKDWADSGRHEMRYQAMEHHRPGLLEASHYQSLETVEWFLGDGPMRCYLEFADANTEDKRVKLLSESVAGFKGSVNRFLFARSKLAIHCSLLGQPVPESMSMLRFLVSKMPDSVDAKSAQGLAPLHIAFQLYREEAARLLIDAGALQTCRDNFGNNILHALFANIEKANKNRGRLPAMLDMVDKRVLPTLLLERNSINSQTPLARWVDLWAGSLKGENHDEEVLRTILRYGEGEELYFIDGEGHTPLHVAVRDGDEEVAQILFEHDPILLLKENAVGRTPFEMAEDDFTAACVKSAPPMPNEWNYESRRARKYGLAHDWKSKLISRDAWGFVEESSRDRRQVSEKMWDLFRQVKAQLERQGHAKRRLVTLNEANEVARRLAATKSQHRSFTRARDGNDDNEREKHAEEDDQDIVDEVQLWFSSAVCA